MKPQLQHIDLGEKQSVLAFIYSKKDFEAPWHFHPEHELIYIRSSSGTKFIGDYVGSYEPGELVLLRSNLPHCWKNQLDPKSVAESIVIQWPKGIYSHVPELDSLFLMLRIASRGIIYSRKDVENLIPLMEELTSLNAQLRYVKFLSLLMDLTGCRYRPLSESSFEDDIPTIFNNRMSRIHDFVEANYHRRIYLRELADLVGMSEQSFSRFFSKMMGRPFFSFLSEYRINVASRMLTNSDWSVSQIGFACGYESLPFFHKQFKKFKNVSPSRYRKNYSSNLNLDNFVD